MKKSKQNNSRRGRGAVLTAYPADNLADIGRADEARPCLPICPGSGYAYCSQRSVEPIALQFLPEAFLYSF